uniref:6-phosphogluconolactonase n=1 Tax=Eucampia antarctica TaxID=49252 RepID=A0A7S2W6D5_9STRA
MTSLDSAYTSKLLICKDKSVMALSLHELVIKSCKEALSSDRGIFSIALSGGSLPSFLSNLSDSFDRVGCSPQWDKWHVLLADERCVPNSDPDSNLKALKESILDSVAIPKNQIYGLDESLLLPSSSSSSSLLSCEERMASAYEKTALRPVLEKSGNKIDCVILGFGPDGHTCSLFPNHALLEEKDKLVASLNDSPKPPLCRITLTFPVLNHRSRMIVFCGAGESKGPILNRIFATVHHTPPKQITTNDNDNVKECSAILSDPAPFPCGMARPNEKQDSNLVYVVDTSAAATLNISKL